MSPLRVFHIVAVTDPETAGTERVGGGYVGFQTHPDAPFPRVRASNVVLAGGRACRRVFVPVLSSVRSLGVAETPDRLRRGSDAAGALVERKRPSAVRFRDETLNSRPSNLSQ